MLTTPGKNYLVEVGFGQRDNVLGTYYVGLLLAAPNADGVTYSEPSGNGYARVAVSNNSTNFGAASAGVVTNLTTIDFPAASGGAWGAVLYAGLFDAASSGTLLVYGSLNPNKYIADGYDVLIPVGGLSLTMKTTT